MLNLKDILLFFFFLTFSIVFFLDDHVSGKCKKCTSVILYIDDIVYCFLPSVVANMYLIKA